MKPLTQFKWKKLTTKITREVFQSKSLSLCQTNMFKGGELRSSVLSLIMKTQNKEKTKILTTIRTREITYGP